MADLVSVEEGHFVGTDDQDQAKTFIKVDEAEVLAEDDTSINDASVTSIEAEDQQLLTEREDQGREPATIEEVGGDSAISAAGGVSHDPIGEVKELPDSCEGSTAENEPLAPRTLGAQEFPATSASEVTVLQAAWTAAVDRHDSVKIHSANVTDPRMCIQLPPNLVTPSLQENLSIPNGQLTQPTTSLPPASGFILTGSISLFNVEGLDADFYSHHGPWPSWIEADDEKQPIYQMAVLRNKLKVSEFLPGFSGTKFDEVSLANVSFCYQNLEVDPTKPIGITCSASIAIDRSYETLHDVLQKVCGFTDPVLNVSSNFRYAGDWHEAIDMPSFCLTGIFTDTRAKSPCTSIQISKVGASLTGFTCLKRAEDMSAMEEICYGFSIFGSLYLNIPGSVTPLEMEFVVSEAEGSVALQASVEGPLEHAFGISQLTLDYLSMEVDLDLAGPLDDLTFAATAAFELGDTLVVLEGHYSTVGNYKLSAFFGQLDVKGLMDLFVHFFNEEVLMPDIDIFLGSATLTVEKDAGFALLVHDLRIGDHTATDGTVTFGSAGLHLKARIAGDVLDINEMQVKNAFAELVFGRKSAGTKTSVSFGGEVEWEGHQFDVAVHVYRDADENGSKLEYTIFGHFQTVQSGAPLPFTTLVPALEDTFMKDIGLREAALVIASRDEADLSELTHLQFPIKKGIQVCAVIDEITPIRQTMGDNHPASLILNAGWVSGIGFSLDIIFPSPTTIHLGRGITTDPIKLRIALGGIPKLMVNAGANIPVEKQVEPLNFIVEIEMDELGAAATGQLSTVGGWKNPFGVSEKLVVGPNLALKLAIIWETFLVQGPSGFGFVGGLAVGKVEGQLAFDVEEIPSRELLSTKIETLDIQDVVSFASYITSLQIAKPPNVIIFEEISMYVCPDGTTIGNLGYPPGFSFSSKVILFGISADISLSVGSEGVKAKGGIDNFTLGSLSVRGISSPRANFDLELTDSKQAGQINGMVDFLGFEVTIVASFSLQPQFTFDFSFDLTFGELFEFTVHASPILTLTEESHDVTAADYRLTADFHEKIRGHMADKLNKMLDERARQEAQEAEHVQEDIEEARKHWQAEVDQKQKKLDAAYAQWTTKTEDANAANNRIVAEEDAKFAVKQKELDDAKSKLRRDVSEAQAKLTAAQNDRASRIKADEEALTRTQSEWDDNIAQKHRKLDEATRELHSNFGDVESKIESTRQKVDSLQSNIDDIDRRVSGCENADWWDLPAKAQIPVLEGEKAGLYIAKEVADGAFSAAEAILQAGDFLACKGAMRAASLALDAAKEAGDLAVKAKEETLEATQKFVDGLVAIAEAVLKEASDVAQGAVDFATKALDEAKEASIAIRKGAEKLLDELKSCAEWVAYEAANAALTTAKAAGSGAMMMAEAGVMAADKVSQVAMRAWHFVLEKLTSFIDITDVQLSAELGAAVGGVEFKASVRGVIGGDQFFGFEVDFNTRNTVLFLKNIFDKLVDLIEDGILEGGKAIADGIEKALD